MLPHALRADAAANRVRLIEAALAVFREHGIDAEVKEIAERAGIGVGTLYRNFPTKDDLLTAVAGEMFDTMDHVTRAAVDVADAIEGVDLLIRQGLANMDRYGDLMEMLMGNMPAGCLQRFGEINPLERVVAVLEKGMRQGVFRADLDPEIAATRIVSAFHPWMLKSLRATHTLDQIADAQVDFFLRGAQS